MPVASLSARSACAVNNAQAYDANLLSCLAIRTGNGSSSLLPSRHGTKMLQPCSPRACDGLARAGGCWILRKLTGLQGRGAEWPSSLQQKRHPWTSKLTRTLWPALHFFQDFKISNSLNGDHVPYVYRCLKNASLAWAMRTRARICW